MSILLFFIFIHTFAYTFTTYVFHFFVLHLHLHLRISHLYLRLRFHTQSGTPEKHKIVRAECCKYMLQNKARFKHWVVEPIGKHVKKMKKQSEWGSEPEIRAMEELYDRPMEIYQCIGDGSNTKTMFFNFKGNLQLHLHLHLHLYLHLHLFSNR